MVKTPPKTPADDGQPTLEDGSPAAAQPAPAPIAEPTPAPETFIAVADDAPPATPTSHEPVADEPAAGTLRVDVKANLSLAGGQVLQVDQGEATVPDTEEVRSCIAAGYLALADGS